MCMLGQIPVFVASRCNENLFGKRADREVPHHACNSFSAKLSLDVHEKGPKP
jgi:hypothetical protein